MLIIAGHSGSGKSTLAASLAAVFPSRVIEVGDIVRARHASARTAAALVDFADEQFRTCGPVCFAAHAAALLKPDSPNIVVGIRRPEEFDFLRQLDGTTRMVWLETPRRLREKRKMASSGRDYHRRRAAIERAWGIDRLPALADLVMNGASPVNQLTEGILEWLSPR
ncbi:MAG TPA: AAA family ATPase [Streptosporangiaceae bacterium]